MGRHMANLDSEAHTSDSANVIIFPPLLLALCVGLGLVLWWLVPAPTLPHEVAIAGAALTAIAGVVLDRWAQRSLRQAGTAVHPSEATEALVSTGAFALSRNPIYVAQGLLLAAVGLALRSPAFLVTLLPWFLVIRLGVVAREERYLQRLSLIHI